MTLYLARLRQLHRTLAPIMVVPIILTLLTGVSYQMASIGGQGANFAWLLDWHVGHFGPLNLETIYPLLNALGLLTLAVTGIVLWLQMRRPRRRA